MVEAVEVAAGATRVLRRVLALRFLSAPSGATWKVGEGASMNVRAAAAYRRGGVGFRDVTLDNSAGASALYVEWTDDPAVELAPSATPDAGIVAAVDAVAAALGGTLDIGARPTWVTLLEYDGAVLTANSEAAALTAAIQAAKDTYGDGDYIDLREYDQLEGVAGLTSADGTMSWTVFVDSYDVGKNLALDERPIGGGAITALNVPKGTLWGAGTAALQWSGLTCANWMPAFIKPRVTKAGTSNNVVGWLNIRARQRSR